MVADNFSRLLRMIDNNVNNKRKRPPENLEDMDRDPTYGPAGIAFFFLIVTGESVIMKRGRGKKQPF